MLKLKDWNEWYLMKKHKEKNPFVIDTLSSQGSVSAVFSEVNE